MFFYWYLSGFFGIQNIKVEDFKNEVVESLNKKGFTPEEYSPPKYVKYEVMKGLKVDTIEIIFYEERNYTYSYMRTADGIEFAHAINEDTGERDYDKEEPIK
ncbi:hypothetical protein [Viridibacillus arvi]|uniref:hypothetical protein n=1 Tax=Viridibacillus arvi TaxID=263475 RepID=UPI00187B8B3B|nr:hypothetical protein [Viridibacillus sp. JNUCC-6]QOV11960.1 hypothetical protein JNUCC6_04075 [Viridibacillus sp. JNUCC-6]